MKLGLMVIVATTLFTLPALAEHRCAADAKTRAVALLNLHMEGTWKIDAANVEGEVKELPPINALTGKGKFDVLEVLGVVYKGNYRLHMIYMQGGEGCTLMGQEIIEIVDPY